MVNWINEAKTKTKPAIDRIKELIMQYKDVGFRLHWHFYGYSVNAGQRLEKCYGLSFTFVVFGHLYIIALNDLHSLCYTACFHRVFHLQFGKYLLAVTANRVFADG